VPRALGVRAVRWNQGADFFVEGAGAEAAHIPLRKVGAFSASLPIPADASRAPPEPPGHDKSCPGPPVTEGLHLAPMRVRRERLSSAQLGTEDLQMNSILVSLQ
jgi:hypothetical protein